METETDFTFPAQVMFVVPKRNFKKAHDRNKLKRRMREVYRLSKNSFYESIKANEKKMVLAFIYTGKKAEEYSLIEAAILKMLTMVAKRKN